MCVKSDKILIQGILGDSPVLPVTQGLVGGTGGGSCPAVKTIPPLPACQGRNSNCWSVGQTDVDCIDNALCCFDGCANVCQGEGARPGIPRPQSNARGQARKTPNSNNSNNSKTAKGNQQSQGDVNAGRNNNNSQEPIPPIQKNEFEPKPKQISNKRPKNRKKGRKEQTKQQPTNHGSPSVSGVGGGLLFPLVSQKDVGYSNTQEEIPGIKNSNTRHENGGVKTALPAQPSQTFIPPKQVQPAEHKTQQRNPKPSNFQQQSQVASSKPYIRCPSAMKCVQKVNCDFEGLITEEVLDLSPELESLRVPLIPCVNRGRGNAVDVCCRDPSYQGSNNQRQHSRTEQSGQQNNRGQTGQQNSREQSGQQNNREQSGQQNNGRQTGQQNNKEQSGQQHNNTQKRKKANAYG